MIAALILRGIIRPKLADGIPTMPDYVYTAKNELGAETTGRITANSKREALDAIHRLKLFPIVVEDSKKGEITIQLFRRRVSDTQIASALLQLADLLDNGVPVLHAFQILEKQTPNPRLKSVIKNIHDRISEGESLDSAFSAHSDVFNNMTVSILSAGAEGAFLEDALRRIGNFLEQQAEIKGKVIGALIYPLIILALGVLLVFAFMFIIMPMFQDMFDLITEQGKPLPLPTQSLILAKQIILYYGFYIIGIAIFLFIWIQGQLSTAWGTRLWDRFKLRIPILGSVILDGAVARFCRVLGTLLANGVPILKSLEISGQSTGNTILADAVRHSAEHVSSGESLAKPLSEAGLIPPQVMAMIGVAEESNTLETVLVNTADSMERHSARKLDLLVRILEPILLLLVGLVVFYLFLALLLPMFSMYDAM
jgi:general secretion pathway protein F/type IV pilus assembly protein PilC